MAVKTLRNSATEKERRDLLQELAVMKMLDPHPNVVRLLGCCTERDPVFLIMEFVEGGGTLQVCVYEGEIRKKIKIRRYLQALKNVLKSSIKS